MTAPIPGSGAGWLPRLPAASAVGSGTGATSTGILAPVRPVGPERGGSPAAGRSGIDMATLLTSGGDLVQPRVVHGAVALVERLEQARGALVRGEPHAVLAALDSGWEGVGRTESGWYFRAAALALLGVPGEAARVVAEAQERFGESVALRFLESLVQEARRDHAGARAALAEALRRAPDQPLLRLWDAILLARRGDRSGARARLTALGVVLAETPVLQWARQAVTRAHTDGARADAVRGTDVSDAHAERTEDAPPEDAMTDPEGPMPGGSAMDGSRVGHARPAAGGIGRTDPLEAALAALGRRLASAEGPAPVADVRALLQALATRGHLVEAANPSREHAARRVLSALLAQLTDAAGGHRTAARGLPVSPSSASPSTCASPALPELAQATAAVVMALRAGAPRLVEHAVQRAQGAVPESELVVLRHLAGLTSQAAAHPVRTARGVGTPSNGAAGDAVIREVGAGAGAFDGLLPPVRFGLVLLQEPSPRQDVLRVAGPAMPRAARDARHAAGRAAFREQTRDARRIRPLPLVLAALGIVALAVGAPVVALALTGAAAWIVLR